MGKYGIWGHPRPRQGFALHPAGEASGELQPTLDKLRARLEPKGLSALEASPAADQNAFAVTRANAEGWIAR